MAHDLTESAQEGVVLAPTRRRGEEAATADRALYAALDLGTNSCRMLIATPDSGRLRVVDAFAKSVRLGAGLERTGHLSRGAIGRTLAALEVCAEKLARYRVASARLVATEACRRARNGSQFLAVAARQTGLRLEVIRPEEEARLAVISCAPLVSPRASQLLVFDIGGGSTELVWLDLSEIAPERRAQAIVDLQMGGAAAPGAARIVDFISVPLGVATLHERYADVVDDSARFALMAWFFEEAIAGFKPYIESTIRAASSPPTSGAPPFIRRLTIACARRSGAISDRSSQTSSVEPPPMSNTSTWRESGATSGAQEITASRASSSGRITSSRSPVCRAASARKALPLRARRQASVATSRTLPT